MIVSAAALGSRWVVCPKQLDLSWRESAVLWGGVVARSGSKKTPSIAKVQIPINDIQKSLDMKFSLALDQYNLEKSCFDNMSKSQKEKTGAVFAKNPPEHERILVNDTTYQKLAKIMSVSPDGIISIADELVGLMKGWEANGQEAARQFYLTAWNGNQHYSVDRMSRESDRIDRCFLCLLGGVQPPVLADYVMQAKLGGAGDDGLIQRFQMLVYPDINIDQVDVDRPADVIAEKEMRKAVIGLRNLSPDSETGFCKQEEGINIIQFDEVVGQAFTKLRRKIEKKALREDADPMMASHLSKMPAVIAKLSMIIHLLDTGIGLINSQALSKAARWAVYLRKHTERIHASATPVEAGSVRKLAQHILDGKMGVDFYARQIERKHWSGLKDEKIVAEALKALVEYNWLRSVVISTGGRPTVHYAVNPKIKGMSL